MSAPVECIYRVSSNAKMRKIKRRKSNNIRVKQSTVAFDQLCLLYVCFYLFNFLIISKSIHVYVSRSHAHTKHSSHSNTSNFSFSFSILVRCFCALSLPLPFPEKFDFSMFLLFRLAIFVSQEPSPVCINNTNEYFESINTRLFEQISFNRQATLK